MRYKYFKFNYYEEYTTVKKNFDNIIKQYNYKLQASIQNDFGYKFELYIKTYHSKEFYIAYIEAKEIDEDFYQLIVDYYLAKYLPYGLYYMYIVFNVENYDTFLEDFVKYGVTMPSIGTKRVYGHLHVPIVIDTKNRAIYVGSIFYKSYVYSLVSYYKMLFDPFINYMKSYYVQIGTNLKSNTEVIKSSYYKKKIMKNFPKKTIYHKYLKKNNYSLELYLIVYIIFMLILLYSRRTNMEYLIAILILIVVGVIGLVGIILTNIKQRKLLLIELRKIKLEPNMKIFKVILSLIKNTNKTNEKKFKNNNFLFIDDTLVDFETINRDSVILLTKGFYKKYSKKLSKEIIKCNNLVFIIDLNSYYIQVINGSKNLKSLNRLLKYIK